MRRWSLIGDYGREQTDYRDVLYMTPLQKTQTIPLTVLKMWSLSWPAASKRSRKSVKGHRWEEEEEGGGEWEGEEEWGVELVEEVIDKEDNNFQMKSEQP